MSGDPNDMRGLMEAQANANAAALNCCGLGQIGWGQQYGYGPPPSPEAQLQQRAAELTRFLAIDHEAKRREAQAELDRINAALGCLKVP